jgi:hypothetical protein
VSIRRRHQIGAFQRRWGENCFESVAHQKPHPVRAVHEQSGGQWGWTQTRVASAVEGPWTNISASFPSQSNAPTRVLSRAHAPGTPSRASGLR